VPRLARIRIYPVKSLDPEELESATLLASGGLEGDRQFALADEFGALMNAKRMARMQRLRSSCRPAERRLRLQFDDRDESFDIDADQSRLERWVSEVLEQPLRWVENPHGGFPDDTEFPGPTFVSTATLETIADWFGLPVDEVRLRFRANLEIGDVEPFWEDRLYAGVGEHVTFRVGGAVFFGTNPCQRCPVPARSPFTGEADAGFQKRFADLRRESLPAWADRSRFDHYYRLAVNTRYGGGAREIHVGDPVEILDAE
jgi:uncharacterized protein YcbX